MSTPQSLSAYRKWYKANKDEYNKKRKADYAADPVKRQAAIDKQRERRKTAPPTTKSYYKPADGRHFRKVGKKNVEVFRIGQVAEMVGRDIQVIRAWHRQNKIPAPTVPGQHRYYTMNQINLLIEFAQLMDQVRYAPKIRAQALETKSEEIKARWANLKES